MPFPKNQLFEQSLPVDLYSEYRVLFFEENWHLKVKAVGPNSFIADRSNNYLDGGVINFFSQGFNNMQQMMNNFFRAPPFLTPPWRKFKFP